jgi:adenosylhomocysteine nucleosidase
VKILTVIPMRAERDFFLQGCVEQGIRAQPAAAGRLPVTRLPELGLTVACGGLGKTQFAVQTQHLIDAAPGWDLVICAGAAGALVEGLSVGDVVIATETVEHDICNKFGRPLIPRFSGVETVVDMLKNRPLSDGSFKIHAGPIASGDEDVIDDERRQAIQRLTGALAVAWEGAGGARACQFSGIPFVEIRGVTDSANSSAALDFEANLASAMRNVAMVITSWARG